MVYGNATSSGVIRFAVLAGITAFYALNYAASGRFPGGWVFPLFFLPGLLAIASWVVDKNCLGGGRCAMGKESN